MFKNKQHSKSQESIELIITQECLQQARYSFYLALAAIALSFGINFAGAALLLYGKAAEGSVVSAAGTVSSVQAVRFAKYANERVDKLRTELKN